MSIKKICDAEIIEFLQSYINDLDGEGVAELYTYLMGDDCVYDDIGDEYLITEHNNDTV